jgi:hypothetical protein
MRLWVSLLLTSFVAIAQGPGEIRGVVSDALSGDPMNRVHVRLISMSQDGFTGLAPAYGAMSDDAGRFSISGIAPGTYAFVPERSGYFYQSSKKSGGADYLIKIAAGEKISDLRLTMAPKAILTGRVLDEGGLPIRSGAVMIDNGQSGDFGQQIQREILGFFSWDIRNDRGEFRISVPAGKYYLIAQSGSESWEISPDGTAKRRVVVNTYYPNASGRAGATVVDAIAGRETAGLDIRMQVKRSLTISGTVGGMPSNGHTEVILRQTITSELQRVPVASDGSFHSGELRPDTFQLYASSSGGSEPLRSTTEQVELENASLPGVSLTLRPLLQIRGTVIAGSSGARPVITLRPQGHFALTHDALRTVSADGSGNFHLDNVEPDRFQLSARSVGSEGYVKSIRIDDDSIPVNNVIDSFGDDGRANFLSTLDLRRAGAIARVKIEIGAGATISGKLFSTDGSVASGIAAVMLIPKNAKDPDDMIQCRIDKQGEFIFHGVPPGKYALTGFDASSITRVDDADHAPDQELHLQDLFTQEDQIEVKEGDRIKRDVHISAKKPQQ